MLKIKGTDIFLTRGDTARITITVSKDGQPYDCSADTVRFSVKRDPQSADYLIRKTASVDGIIYIAPADTDGLAYGNYVYDVELTTSGGDVCTVVPPSKFIIGPEVTWAQGI